MKPDGNISIRQDELERDLRKHMLGLSFEERLMDRKDYFEAAEAIAGAVQDELVDAYVNGDLDEEERTAFERRLAPLLEVQKKIQLARSLHAASRRTPAPAASWAERLGQWLQPVLQPAPALAAVMVLVAVTGATWSVYRMSEFEKRLGEAAAVQATLREGHDELQNQLALERGRGNRIAAELNQAQARLSAMQQSPSPSPVQRLLAFSTFVLRPGLMRSGGDTTRVPVAPEPGLVELRLDIGIDDWETYSATLIDSSADSIMSRRGLETVTAGGSVYAVLQVPAQVLAPDDYRVRLEGRTSGGQNELIDTYQFRAIAQ